MKLLFVSKYLIIVGEGKHFKPQRIYNEQKLKYTKSYQKEISAFNTKKLWVKPPPKDKRINREDLKVFIVEDNQFSIFPISATLKRNHINFDIAKNGVVAIETFERNRKDG